LVLVYRIGSYVVLPGVDPSQLGGLQSQTQEGIMGLLNMFSGGAFANASIFALGIMPYITASIVVQLFVMVVPYFQKMQREGESGRRKMTQITRYLTILVTILQGPAYIANMMSQLGASPTAIYPFDGTDPSWFFWVSSILILTSGTLFVMWLGERITDKGIGNGISLLIMVGIIARLPFALVGEFGSRMEEGGGLIMFLVEIVIWLVVILLCILLVQGTRKIPVQYAKRVVGNKQYGGVRQYLPLKVNAAGVMPIIFAQAIMFVPITLLGFSNSESGFLAAFSDFNGFWYNFVFAILIIAFTFFYTAIAINPNQMADDMKKNGGFIPGIRAGKPTSDYLANILKYVSGFGSIFLGIIAVLPILVQFAGLQVSFGGTAILIVVSVALESIKQLESQMMVRHYKGFLD
jgi:preprotein translocase subunit SecY